MKQQSFSDVELWLEKPKHKRLCRGLVCQLKHHNLVPEGAGIAITLNLSDKKVRQIMKAKKNKKGYRLSLTPQELELSGSGLKDFFSSVKQGAKKAKAFYTKSGMKDILGPLAKKGTKKLVQEGLDKLTDIAAVSVPVVGPALQALDESGLLGKAVDVAGQKMGVWGKGFYGGAAPQLYGGVPMAYPDGMYPIVYNPMAPFYSAAMIPHLGYYRGHGAMNSGEKPFEGDVSGGSFRMPGPSGSFMNI